MFLTRIELAANASDQPAFWREVTSPEGAHQVLWRLFRRSPEQKRDFLFRQDAGRETGPRCVRFYVLSHEPPRTDTGGLWRIDEPKLFAPKLQEGDRLRFSLRASATVKRSLGPRGTGGKRCDVVMDTRKKSPGATPPLNRQRLIQVEGERWLQRQAANAGFELASGPADVIDDDGLMRTVERCAVRIDGYRQYQLQRRNEAPIRFSTLDFEGILTVRDPARFLQKVTLGFGPQKAFGCGLMLLRRA